MRIPVVNLAFEQLIDQPRGGERRDERLQMLGKGVPEAIFQLAVIAEVTPEIDLTEFFRMKQVVVSSEPVGVEDVAINKPPLVKVDEAVNDLSDAQPFEDTQWWWETSRGLPKDTKGGNAA